MGRKGRPSARGIGEIDAVPRNCPLFCKITKADYDLLCAAAEKLNKSKAQIVTELIRKNLSKYTRYIAKPEAESENL